MSDRGLKQYSIRFIFQITDQITYKLFSFTRGRHFIKLRAKAQTQEDVFQTFVTPLPCDLSRAALRCPSSSNTTTRFVKTSAIHFLKITYTIGTIGYLLQEQNFNLFGCRAL